MFVSETYSIWDTIQYDKGYDTDHHDVWDLSANIEMSRTPNGTVFSANGTGQNYIALNNGTPNSQLFFDSTKDFALEYRLQTANQLGVYLGILNDRNKLNLSYHNTNLNKWLVKVINTEEKAYVYMNNDTTPYYTYDIDFNDEMVGFRIVDWQGDANILLKDFKAYYI